jgi:hypothetical protein
VTRPGRCLAVTEFRRFEAHEAARWLGVDTPAPDGPATLAELFALRDGEGFGPLPAQPERIGAYL